MNQQIIHLANIDTQTSFIDELGYKTSSGRGIVSKLIGIATHSQDLCLDINDIKRICSYTGKAYLKQYFFSGFELLTMNYIETMFRCNKKELKAIQDGAKGVILHLEVGEQYTNISLNEVISNSISSINDFADISISMSKNNRLISNDFNLYLVATGI